MLEIGRTDGLPVVARPGARAPLVLLLERGVSVGASQPFRFNVEWSGEPSSTGG